MQAVTTGLEGPSSSPSDSKQTAAASVTKPAAQAIMDKQTMTSDKPVVAATTTKTKKSKQQTIHYPFWFGGSASSMAATVTHPLDLVKVRLQMRTGDAPKTMSGTVLHIIRHNGITGLYNGLSASLLRQITYSTTRFGIYEELKTRFTTKDHPASFPVLIAMATVSGVAGGLVGNVADVLNVRMQHDAALPPAQRRNYAHAIDGLARMTREEGFRSWFRGVWPNSARAAAMTASQLASYDVFKRILIRHTPLEDNLATHFSASFLAGVAAATVTSPIDVVKTRVMSASGKSSIGQVLGSLYAQEGVRWMFKGWVPSFLRLGPQTICTFIFLEGHRKMYKKVKGIEE
ncbi:mitochondrial carrier [Neurospora crassa]|uniref:Mitochondrial dicarboxylate carrier n=2 Tax=Neurospora crassa TaxID=5141 RepID=Q1K5K2_NEUCR|nr:mitochondrial dicarboxylate carrier [Neurospora crassa OR74A]EAA27727.2 mitochondrial dicarboxylate carrier [Neurospora crassa OR74A]KHE78861.1 mitochondrial carrier [Neurospora crassa]|eukprot:XP_956963.2 mitochondrial dicarboxylate carrier [Neurospora crassa OR74A]